VTQYRKHVDYIYRKHMDYIFFSEMIDNVKIDSVIPFILKMDLQILSKENDSQ
jgi:hypothetical protein